MEEAIARVSTPSRNEFVRLEMARKPLRLEQSKQVSLSQGGGEAGGSQQPDGLGP